MHGKSEALCRVQSEVLLIVDLLLNLLLDQLHVFESLIIYASTEELVKVKLMVHQEFDVARLELHH